MKNEDRLYSRERRIKTFRSTAEYLNYVWGTILARYGDYEAPPRFKRGQSKITGRDS